ncbi:NUDIX hydrolase [Microbacterium sp. STN6]|uniref:NUDIX domain-containing protein n=1 Tax=Microbacterium sp. STN6 TaxID=2995588 RepID=UPI0022608208|nr:NUDIX hydrolase [Microbacterium sp. STN6]MCX7521354.1 NUDIX hydrolase [Microbacterium sp. STN6]
MSETDAAGDDFVLRDEPYQVQQLSRETAFEGTIWNVDRDTFRLHDDELTREYLDHTGAVAIVALDDEDRLLVIRQYRHPVRSRLWEIPAGLLDVTDEPPLAAAQRELAEEADMTASTWSVLAEFYTSPGSSSEAIRIYLARGLAATEEAYKRHGEEAGIEVRWVPLDDAVSAVLERRVQNPSMVVGVLAAAEARRRGWATLSGPETAWPRHPKWAARH